MIVEKRNYLTPQIVTSFMKEREYEDCEKGLQWEKRTCIQTNLKDVNPHLFTQT